LIPGGVITLEFIVLPSIVASVTNKIFARKADPIVGFVEMITVFRDAPEGDMDHLVSLLSAARGSGMRASPLG
jgi:hypothetical protein